MKAILGEEGTLAPWLLSEGRGTLELVSIEAHVSGDFPGKRRPKRMAPPARRELIIHVFARYLFDQFGLSRRTVTDYVNMILAAEIWLREERKGCSVAWADPKDLQAFLFSRKPSATTRNQYRKALVRWGDFMVQEGYSKRNPARELPRLPTPKSLPKPLGVEEARGLVEAASDPMDLCFITAGLYQGLRFSEILNMEWPSLNMVEGFIRFKQKGGSERHLPLHQVFRDALAAWRPACSDPRWVFPSPRKEGARASHTYIRSRLREVFAAAGFYAVPHTLRHTFGTRLRQKGTPIEVVQKALGHASIRSTMIYAAVFDPEVDEALSSLDY